MMAYSPRRGDKILAPQNQALEMGYERPKRLTPTLDNDALMLRAVRSWCPFQR